MRLRAAFRTVLWYAREVSGESAYDNYLAHRRRTHPGEPVLTRREFELLQVLAEASGRVIEREEIYQRVWGYAMAHGDRSVDVFVRKLRSKLHKQSPGWDYIHTHFGVGYRFEPEPVSPAEVEAPRAVAGDVLAEVEDAGEARLSRPQ